MLVAAVRGCEGALYGTFQMLLDLGCYQQAQLTRARKPAAQLFPRP